LRAKGKTALKTSALPLGLKMKIRSRQFDLYRMLKDLEQMDYAVEENTLYPLLGRLEKNGWIASQWNASEDRRKKFYVITNEGKTVRGKALEIWRKQTEILGKMEKENQ
jgi:DNA-binding PadR family transcriptional regulator